MSHPTNPPPTSTPSSTSTGKYTEFKEPNPQENNETEPMSLDDYIDPSILTTQKTLVKQYFDPNVSDSDFEKLANKLRELISSHFDDTKLLILFKKIHHLLMKDFEDKELIRLLGVVRSFASNPIVSAVVDELKNERELANKVPEDKLNSKESYIGSLIDMILDIASMLKEENNETVEKYVTSACDLMKELDGNAVITLISSTNERFNVSKKAAEQSKFLKADLENNPNKTELKLDRVESLYLKKVIEYMNYHVHNEMKPIPVPLTTSKLVEVVGEWDANFAEMADVLNDKSTFNEEDSKLPEVEKREIVFYKLAFVANFLVYEPLLFLICSRIAILQRDYPLEKLRQIFVIAEENNNDNTVKTTTLNDTKSNK